MLADRVLEVPPRPRKGPQCGTCRLLARLPEGERDALAQMLTDDAWTTPAIHRTLVDEGIDPPGLASLANHRRGDCLGSRA